MKNLHEKIAKLNEFLPLDAEFKEELAAIIKDTYDYCCSWVNGYDISEDGKTIDCHYTYRCRGESDNDSCDIPIRWLEDGFDYKADYEAMQERAEEERKRMEEEKKKKEQARKEAAEYETYLKLKKKYES